GRDRAEAASQVDPATSAPLVSAASMAQREGALHVAQLLRQHRQMKLPLKLNLRPWRLLQREEPRDHSINPATGIWPIDEWGSECGRGRRDPDKKHEARKEREEPS